MSWITPVLPVLEYLGWLAGTVLFIGCACALVGLSPRSGGRS
jgi:hypothetical protein